MFLAVAGALVTAFIAFVLIRWVTGPYFARVPAGPSDPPTFMKVNAIFWQVVSIPLALAVIWWYVVRPWRRERDLGVDGCLVIAFSLLWFQDPLSNYAGPWFTYNTWLFNRGSWTNDVPGWLSYGSPGHMVGEPLLMIPALYVYWFVLAMIVGCWVMRTVATRRPQASGLTLVAACFAFMCLFDLVFEGLIWMPLGTWTYAGGQWSLFPSTYHKFPLNDMVTVAAVLTSVSCIRFFRNDRGQTIAERGIERVGGSSRKRLAVRVFAMIAVVQAAMLFYTVPNAWFGMHSTTWPADLQKRSYLTGGLCGDGTDRACPGPGVPLLRNDNAHPGRGSAHVDPAGRLVIPDSSNLRPAVPFDRGPLGSRGD